jgi:hypothetical protein
MSTKRAKIIMLNDMPMSVCVGTVGEALEELRREKAEYIENRDPSLGFGLRCGSQVHPSTCIHAGARKEASESKTAQHVD